MRETSLKRRLITFERIIKAGFVNFFRNITLSIAATAVMVVTLTIILFSVIANATFNNTINQINDQIDISVRLKDDVTEEQRNNLINRPDGLSNVKSVEYSSKEQELENYRRDNSENVVLQQAFSLINNPLSAIIKLKPNDPNRLQEITEVLESPEIKPLQSAPTSYSGDKKTAIDRITSATNFFNRAVAVGIVIFAVISVLIIFNTIQMAIFNRRDELTIMRLLGAGTFFIRGPFIVETMLYGIVSAIASLSIVNALFTIQSRAIDANTLSLLDIKYANQYFSDNFWLFLLLQLIAGMAIGALSAMIATQRYLGLKPKRSRR